MIVLNSIYNISFIILVVFQCIFLLDNRGVMVGSATSPAKVRGALALPAPQAIGMLQNVRGRGIDASPNKQSAPIRGVALRGKTYPSS